ncbi:hypothetical protein BD413DRAFT_609572 [Trametes elegans]|nr:hypothetical protein BD413DRAFT_609572 [Trametes elegans]
MQLVPSPSQLTLDLRSVHTHLRSRPSMDSGYASSLASPPLPADWMLSRMYENWKIADAAAQRLAADLPALNECKTQLREARKAREMDKRSPAAKRRPALLPLFKKRSTPALKQPQPSSSTVPPLPSSGGYKPSLEELQERLVILENRVAATRSAAERLDNCFDELRRVLDDGRPVSWRSSRSSSGSSTGSSYAESYKRARKTVAAREEAYQSSKATTKAMQRACLAVQSAHHHYSRAMDLLDVVCSPKKNKWEAIVGDEQSRQETYKGTPAPPPRPPIVLLTHRSPAGSAEASQWASKAQICFNQCLSSLEPHIDLLKREEAEACADLQETGLLQALQLYKLMYGGRPLAMGITQQVQTMLQKQDAVFQRLTGFAVWVQDCTRHCGAVEREARAGRDAARRALVALWVRADADSETFSLSAPGEHAHVFLPQNR